MMDGWRSTAISIGRWSELSQFNVVQMIFVAFDVSLISGKARMRVEEYASLWHTGWLSLRGSRKSLPQVASVPLLQML